MLCRPDDLNEVCVDLASALLYLGRQPLICLHPLLS